VSNSPNFATKEFMTAAGFNTAASTTLSASHDTNDSFHTPGIISAGSVAITVAAMVATVSLPAPFAVEFGSGVLAFAHGTQTNADTHTYTVNFAPLIPGSGSVTAYLLASAVTIQQQPYTVIGPPQGHPSYNPNFIPFTAYALNVESVSLTASTTPADNVTTFELGRTTLTFGQTTLAALDKTHIQQASSILAPTGVAPGTYTTPTATVGADGRITSMSSTGPYVLLTATSQTITGAVTVTGLVTSDGGFVAPGTAGANLGTGGITTTGAIVASGQVSGSNIVGTTGLATGSAGALTVGTGASALGGALTVAGLSQFNANVGMAVGLSVTGEINTSSQLQLNDGSYSAGAHFVGAAAGNNNPYSNASPGIVLTPSGSLNTFGSPWENGNDGGPFIVFGLNGTTVGNISNNGAGGVVYSTTSDYRIKENVTDYDDARSIIKSVPVHRYNVIGYTVSVSGFLAHELAVGLPGAVIGEKDAVKVSTGAVLGTHGNVIAEGVSEADFQAEMAKPKSAQNGPRYPEGATWSASVTKPVLQQVDMLATVPTIWAGLREAYDLIDALSDRVAALEAAAAPTNKD
jgi:hypothetical protein